MISPLSVLQLRATGGGADLYRGRKMSPVKRFMEASRGNSSAVITRGVKYVGIPMLLSCGMRHCDGIGDNGLCRDNTAQWRAHDPKEVLRFYGLLDESHKPFGDRLHFRYAHMPCMIEACPIPDLGCDVCSNYAC